MEKKIAVIGAGNLGLSLAKGLVESKTTNPINLTYQEEGLKS